VTGNSCEGERFHQADFATGLPYGKCPMVRTEQSRHFKFIAIGVEVQAHVVNCGIDSEAEKA